MKVQRPTIMKVWMKQICRHHRRLWNQLWASIMSRALTRCKKFSAALQLMEPVFVWQDQEQLFRFIRKGVIRWVELNQKTILAQTHQTMTTAPMIMHQRHRQRPLHSWKIYLHKEPTTMSQAIRNSLCQRQYIKLTEDSARKLIMKWLNLFSLSMAFA